MTEPPPISPVPIRLVVNGKEISARVEPRTLAVHFLRETLRLTGAHVGCVVGRCGACTVLCDGEPVKSCMIFAAQLDGVEVTTVEGLATNSELHPLQTSFRRHDAAECGFCTPGMLMSACGLLERNPDPSTEDIQRAISGNLCRCTGYMNIVAAIQGCAQSRRTADEFAPSGNREDC